MLQGVIGAVEQAGGIESRDMTWMKVPANSTQVL